MPGITACRTTLPERIPHRDTKNLIAANAHAMRGYDHAPWGSIIIDFKPGDLNLLLLAPLFYFVRIRYSLDFPPLGFEN